MSRIGALPPAEVLKVEEFLLVNAQAREAKTQGAGRRFEEAMRSYDAWWNCKPSMVPASFQPGCDWPEQKKVITWLFSELGLWHNTTKLDKIHIKAFWKAFDAYQEWGEFMDKIDWEEHFQPILRDMLFRYREKHKIEN